MTNPILRLHHFLDASQANGPGTRAVIWVQGCTLGCPGCFNSDTHPVTGGEIWPVDKLVQRVTPLKGIIEGITISGGEPLQQLPGLLTFLQQVRGTTGLSVLIFTGYTWAEVQNLPDAEDLLACVDVLIAGRYIPAQHLGHHLLGSANQTIHILTDRYTLSDLQAVPTAEIIITASGEVMYSGIDPL